MSDTYLPKKATLTVHGEGDTAHVAYHEDAQWLLEPGHYEIVEKRIFDRFQKSLSVAMLALEEIIKHNKDTPGQRSRIVQVATAEIESLLANGLQ